MIPKCTDGKVQEGYKCVDAKPLPKPEVLIDFKNGGAYTNTPTSPQPTGNRDLMTDYLTGGAYTNLPK